MDVNGKEKEIIFFTNHIRQCIEALFLGPVTFFDALKGQNPTHACPEQSVEFWQLCNNIQGGKIEKDAVGPSLCTSALQ